MDEEFPRVYFTRERHRRDRLYFGPYSSAKRTRSTLDTLGKIFMYRSCQRRRSRGGAAGRRAWTTTSAAAGRPASATSSQDEYREAIDGVIAFLQGRYREIEQRPRGADEGGRRRPRVRAGGDRAQPAAGGALAARAASAWPTRRSARVDAVGGRDVGHRRQRAGLPGPRRRAVGPPVVLPRQRGRARARPRCSRSSCSSTTPRRRRSRRRSSSRHDVDPIARRAAGRAARRRAWRSGAPSAATSAASSTSPTRNATLALETERLKAERSRQQRVEALDELQHALGLDALPLRIECFDISNLMGTHTTASMVVFEGGAPKKSDYRRFNVRRPSERRARRLRVDGGGARAAPGAVGAPAGPLAARPQAQRVVRDAAEPHRHRRRPRPARRRACGRCRASASAASRSSRWPSASRRSSSRGSATPIVLPHDTPALQLLQRVRDEAHRFAITHHRTRRDQAMTESILDGLPGHRPDAQARAAQALRLAGRGARRPRARSSRRCRACRRRPRASSTRTCACSADGEIRRVTVHHVAMAATERTGAAGERAAPQLEDLVVITGFSGAGKSTAMNVFEDAGYFCVDNLPPEMIRGLAELFRHPGQKIRRAAVVCDVRGGEFFDSLLEVLDELPTLGLHAPDAVPRRRRRHAAHALQGDAPAPSAGARGQRGHRHRRRARRCSSRCASAPTSSSTRPG